MEGCETCPSPLHLPAVQCIIHTQQSTAAAVHSVKNAQNHSVRRSVRIRFTLCLLNADSTVPSFIFFTSRYIPDSI